MVDGTGCENNDELRAGSNCGVQCDDGYVALNLGILCYANADAGGPTTAVSVGLGRTAALYHRASTLHRTITSIFGASFSEAAMRPNPR